MQYLNIAAAVATLASLVFALWVYAKDRQRRRLAAASVEVLQERIRGVESVVRAAATNTELLIRGLGDRSIPPAGMQHVARAIRADLYAAILTLKNTNEDLLDYNFGALLHSTDPGRAATDVGGSRGGPPVLEEDET